MKGLSIFLHGILPSFLLAVSIGQIYAFTNFSTDIALSLNVEQNIIQFAFSLGIFFLGIGAAFFGPIIERNIKLSAIIGTILFLSGFIVTQIGVLQKSISLIYIGYGLLLGLGTGVIYVTPVKTMMLWLPKWKAVAAALPIIFFGLGSTFFTILYSAFSHLNINEMLWLFIVIYAIIMCIGGSLLKKPNDELKILTSNNSNFSYLNLLKNKFFIHAWLFMFINISAGLCFIPLAKQLMNSKDINYSTTAIAMFVALSGIFNGGGRFIFAFISDQLKERFKIILFIILISILPIAFNLSFTMFIGVTLLFVNACYGAGFSVIPAILSDKFGMTNISKIHGAVLSAWGFAGLFGNQLALIAGKIYGVDGVILLVIGLHVLNLINYFIWKKQVNTVA